VFFYRIEHDYEEMDDRDREYMQSIKERLFYAPLGEPTGDYLIQGFARALFGEHTKRIFFTWARQMAAMITERS
jgi:hypothetical protein